MTDMELMGKGNCQQGGGRAGSRAQGEEREGRGLQEQAEAQEGMHI